MSAAGRILVAVDESENSHRVAQYVGSLLCRTPDVVVTSCHFHKPMPRSCWSATKRAVRDEQDAWIWKELESECHVLKQAHETLRQLFPLHPDAVRSRGERPRYHQYRQTDPQSCWVV